MSVVVEQSRHTLVLRVLTSHLTLSHSFRYTHIHTVTPSCTCCTLHSVYLRNIDNPSVHTLLTSYSTIGSKECTPTLLIPYSTIGTTHTRCSFYTKRYCLYTIGVEQCRGTLFVPYSIIGDLWWLNTVGSL